MIKNRFVFIHKESLYIKIDQEGFLRKELKSSAILHTRQLSASTFLCALHNV